ncbi:MAG: hypothetical protein HY392_04305 [Candidatus Diapherotrites archaeon]|nr:hypothetical protein [Candidatus Diapherotrites archaeon]
MNRRGFSFAVIALAALAATISLQNTRFNAEKQADTVLTQALEMEKVTFTRTQMENIFDDTVKTALENEIKNNNLDAQEIKKKTVEKIIWLSEQGLFDSGSIKAEFFIEKHGAKEKISDTILGESSSVLVISEEGITTAWFFFTGGILRDTHFKARISGPNYSTEFMLPIGYSMAAVVALK